MKNAKTNEPTEGQDSLQSDSKQREKDQRGTEDQQRRNQTMKNEAKGTLNLYSIKDIFNGFTPPVVMPNHETAKRWFKDMVEENPTMRNNPEDFTVHFIGHMSIDTGVIYPALSIYLEKSLMEIPTEEVKEK